MEKICIHNYEKQYEYYIDRLGRLEIPEKNLDCLLKFKDSCFLNEWV